LILSGHLLTFTGFYIAEHPIGTLAPCGTSIVYLPAEF
jgi:hypothetical protein